MCRDDSEDHGDSQLLSIDGPSRHVSNILYVKGGRNGVQGAASLLVVCAETVVEIDGLWLYRGIKIESEIRSSPCACRDRTQCRYSFLLLCATRS